ncbi:MAG: hypothetical protein IKP89_09920 [Bacteroidales bacterium]|jgi:hypothetical protein|nr:hypothetical protein [Bacteroidales bacterium]
MGDKRDFNAFCGAADVTLCGLPHAEGAKYVPPTAEVTVFALEKGFATSTDLTGKSADPDLNNPTPAGKFEQDKDWSNSTWN